MREKWGKFDVSISVLVEGNGRLWVLATFWWRFCLSFEAECGFRGVLRVQTARFGMKLGIGVCHSVLVGMTAVEWEMGAGWVCGGGKVLFLGVF